jgi:hypothetical protein
MAVGRCLVLTLGFLERGLEVRFLSGVYVKCVVFV